MYVCDYFLLYEEIRQNKENTCQNRWEKPENLGVQLNAAMEKIEEDAVKVGIFNGRMHGAPLEKCTLTVGDTTGLHSVS